MQQSSRVFFIRMFKGVLSPELVDQEQKNANGNQQKTRLEASKPPTYFTTALIRWLTADEPQPFRLSILTTATFLSLFFIYFVRIFLFV